MKAIQIRVVPRGATWRVVSDHWCLAPVEGLRSRQEAISYAFEIADTMRSREKRPIVVVIDCEDPGGERRAA